MGGINLPTDTHWRFKTVADAKKSSAKIYKMCLAYLKAEDFPGADMVRKFLQMGWTRARRYASPYVEEALRWLPDDVQSEGVNRSELPTYHESLPMPYIRPERAGGDYRPRVLVVDDNADMREYVARLLAERYRIQVVPDGEAALGRPSSARCCWRSFAISTLAFRWKTPFPSPASTISGPLTNSESNPQPQSSCKRTWNPVATSSKPWWPSARPRE